MTQTQCDKDNVMKLKYMNQYNKSHEIQSLIACSDLPNNYMYLDITTGYELDPINVYVRFANFAYEEWKIFDSTTGAKLTNTVLMLDHLGCGFATIYPSTGSYNLTATMCAGWVGDYCPIPVNSNTIPVTIVPKPPCTNPKYKCAGTQCVSDNCDATGTWPDTTCGGTCKVGGGGRYSCMQNKCLPSVCTGTINCYADNSCGGACCRPDCEPDGLCLMGSCYSKNDIYAVIGVFALFMLMSNM